MQVEIERKFLIRNESWRAAARDPRHISDHLIATFDGGKARIRICDDTATLTFKGRKRGLSRSEYHIDIAQHVAQAMIHDLVTTTPLEKTRCDVRVDDLIWHVDEYHGRLAGFVTADVELPSEEHDLVLPDWIGSEVTFDRRFGATALAAVAQEGDRAVSDLFRAANMPNGTPSSGTTRRRIFAGAGRRRSIASNA